jgi:hypothetical protein
MLKKSSHFPCTENESSFIACTILYLLGFYPHCGMNANDKPSARAMKEDVEKFQDTPLILRVAYACLKD